jgi:dihydroorotate dehydrogenase (NAD+) catalytic subunit
MNHEINIANVTFKNPIWVASGTFSYGEEFTDFINLDKVGAIVTKTVTLNAKEGNPPPRIIETASGLLNSIGLQNKGAKVFRGENYARLKKIKTNIIISIAGETAEEFVECVRTLDEQDFPAAFELNLSCPNVTPGKTKCKLIAQDPEATEQIVRAIKKETNLPVIAKLSPNVMDIVKIAQAAERGGADAVSLVNTYFGMAVDLENRKPLLFGGLSGPAIKPLALKAVWEAHNNISIPIIGIGGIMTGADVAEFMLCGAKAVQIGTANLVDPDAYVRILQEFKGYL